MESRLRSHESLRFDKTVKYTVKDKMGESSTALDKSGKLCCIQLITITHRQEIYSEIKSYTSLVPGIDDMGGKD